MDVYLLLTKHLNETIFTGRKNNEILTFEDEKDSSSFMDL